MATDPLQMAAGDPALLDAVQRSRKLLNRRAMQGGAMSAVPVPGVDWVVDAALLSKLIPAINAEFGLTPEQIAQLPERKRSKIHKAASAVGSLLVGKFITQDLVIRAVAAAGKRLLLKQVTKFVPFAGPIISAAVGYSAIRALGEEHIRDCVQVCLQAEVEPPETAEPMAATASAHG